MEFRILGPLEVQDGDRLLPLGAGQQRALLALLLLRANHTISRDRLIHELWGERPPDTAAKALQGHVSALRKLLEPNRARAAAGRVIVTRGSGYELRLESEQLDFGRFERLCEEGRGALARNEPGRAAGLLREALALWRGPALADFAYEPFAQSEIARLEELRLTTLEDRFEADLAAGRDAALVGELEAVVNEHPLRERLRGQLMLALYRAGRQAEALEVYQAAREALVEELGIEPGRRLRDLHQAVLRQDPELDSAAVEPTAGPAADKARGVFVGREAELAELRAGLESALAGRGRLVLLVGEPGIGKSRLADELIRHARGRGVRVLTGRCWEAGGAPAYWPWLQSLRACVRELEPEALSGQLGAGAAELAQILPEIREIVPGLPEPASLESEGARFRLFEAAAELLRNASRDRPILLVLDDLHAADAPSLLLLEFLTREIGSSRILVLGAYRDVDPTPGGPLTQMLGQVVRESVTRRLSLPGLSDADVAEYVERTASDLASPRFVAALHEETGGNPLFVSEMVLLLAAERVRPDSSAEIRLGIPQSVHDVIARRLGHLSGECNRLLVLASVLGREFDLDPLARLGEVSQDELLETLDEAMSARIVSDVPGGRDRLRFAHVLIRDALYEGLTTARRVRLHRQVVEALDARYGDEAGAHLAELAHHAMAGSDFPRGLREARRAGDRALALLAYEEAARLYAVALEALDVAAASDEETRCELLLLLGEAQSRAGDTRAAKGSILEAADIARRLGLPRELARAAAAYGGRIVFARADGDDPLLPLLEEGLAALGDEDLELRARLLARLTGVLRDEHARERRDLLSREAVELARRAGDDAALAYALDARAGSVLAPDTVLECLDLSTELREVAERNGDRERVAQGHMHRFVHLVILAKLDEAEAELEAASRIAKELKQPAHLWDVCGGRAMLALAAGRLDVADELAEQALGLGEHTLPAHAILVYRLQRYALCDLRGSLEQSEPDIRDLISQHPDVPTLRCVLAHLQARLGRLADAKRTFDQLAEDDFSALPFNEKWLYATSLLTETAALLDDGGSAGSLYELLLPWAAFNVVDAHEGIRGSVARYLGILAATTGRWKEAEGHFEEALAMNARMGLRPWLAHSQHDYARMLLARRSTGDPERARALLDAALATYGDLGMEGYATEASTLSSAAARS
ncbi:MAG TPA: BTAD domain-containing putative transcriptional regulator [Gaiellaceae bacterium]|nr:BTAD domain-containing putative transcriptional regulator [Gaiellaceae bacterium]